MTEYGEVLMDPTQPLDARIRALHELREPNNPLTLSQKISYLMKTISGTRSVLLLHEVMYALGQIGEGDAACVAFLGDILVDIGHDVVTRHEAGEALGAMMEPSALGVLASVVSPVEVAETCYLSIVRIKGSFPRVTPGCEYSSVDPAPPHTVTDADYLRALLNDPLADLFERYRAMFAMRDAKDVVGLVAAMVSDKSSALLRHEVAFVLGQLEDIRSVDGLVEMLTRKEEHPMVRHEAAEALGAIATPTCWDAINTYANPDHEPDQLVRDSCVVAQDMYRYYQKWSSANRAKCC